MYIEAMSEHERSQQKNLNFETTVRELDFIRMALDKSAIVAITDAQGKIIHINDKFCEISKYSREELLGKKHNIINSGYHSKEFFVNMWRTISSGQIWADEIRNRAKDGSYYWVYTTIVPFLDESGRPHQYVSIRFEITRMKNAEEQLKGYAQKLEMSNKELQDFASVAAHDLQEPLRKILTFSERLKTKSIHQLTEESQDYINRMVSAASRMRVLIDDLLAYSRITTKKQRFVMVDLKQLVSEVISDLEVRIEQTGAKINVGDLPVISADPLQMRQMFQNLISNSLKFKKQDVPPVIDIKAITLNEHCEIRVKDNGIGFDVKYLDRIFTIFQRLHGRQEYEGTGVGLAIVRRIIERHKGSVTAMSEPGIGAEFIVRLPIKHSEDV